jgi:copper(I)-binding protein
MVCVVSMKRWMMWAGAAATMMVSAGVAHANVETEKPHAPVQQQKLIKAASIEVTDAYAFPSLGLNRPSVAFLTMKNISDTARTLVAASADEWCDHAELHEHTTVKNVMQMRKVDGIAIVAHEITQLKPMGYHVMLMGMKKPLRAGEKITLTLRFDDDSVLEVPVNVRARGM